MSESVMGTPQFTASYQLDKQELKRVFDHAFTGHASRLRLIVQSVLLGLVGAASLYDFIALEPHRGMSLFIAIASLIIGVGQWLVMPLFRHNAIKDQVADAATIRFSLYEDGVGFGSGDSEMRFGFENCGHIALDDMVILRVGRDFVGVPNRVISDDIRLILTENIPPVSEK